MTFKRFAPKDIVYNTIVTKPEVNFMIHSGTTFYQFEKEKDGNFSNKIKHIPSGHISLHERNINRPSGSLIYPFIEKSSTRYAWATISTSEFDDSLKFNYGEPLTGAAVDSSSLGRIYIPAGIEFNSGETSAHYNKRYIRSLKSAINAQGHVGTGIQYNNLGTEEVNMLCVPGIFYGSKIDRGSIELEYFVTGALTAKATDKFSDGRLIQISGPEPTNGTQIGSVIYNHGIFILTSSANLHSYTDKFNGASSASVEPKWTNFGTGAKQVGTIHSHTAVVSSSYSIKFKGVNKIPTLTMYAYAKKGELNYSSNPTFTSTTSSSDLKVSSSFFIERQEKIKTVNKSIYADHEENFQSTTYITKIGIYDKYKNLIAVASLANPVKKTEKRDFMFKLGIDF